MLRAGPEHATSIARLYGGTPAGNARLRPEATDRARPHGHAGGSEVFLSTFDSISAMCSRSV
jgi:hypothetical protein